MGHDKAPEKFSRKRAIVRGTFRCVHCKHKWTQDIATVDKTFGPECPECHSLGVVEKVETK